VYILAGVICSEIIFIQIAEPSLCTKKWTYTHKCSLEYAMYNYLQRHIERGHALAQLVGALRYKSEGRGFDSGWCHWIFLST
jgi:hypothetical protein